MFTHKNMVLNKLVIWHLFLHHFQLQLKNVKNSKLVRYTLKSRTLIYMKKNFSLKNFFYFSVPLISYISLIYLQWGLVCDREFVGPLITTTYFCGVMLGGIFFGSLSDKFGRKNMMLICLYTQCVIGIGIHFVRRLVVFIGLRFIQGIFIQVSTI